MNKDRLYLNEKEICCLLLGGAGVLGVAWAGTIALGRMILL